MMKTPLILSVTALLGLSACVTGDPYANSADPNARAKGGAITGAVIGGVLGAITADDHKADKALAGVVLGGLAGGAIGAGLDKQAAELRAVNSAFTVTNMGDYLIVNMPQDVLFATDSAALRPDLQSSLAAVAANLNRYPNSTIEVIGHADNSGSAAYNQDLSERRALSVAGVLRANGVAGGRVAAYGRGENQPVASNLTPEGRAQNRRVEIIIRPTR